MRSVHIPALFFPLLWLLVLFALVFPLGAQVVATQPQPPTSLPPTSLEYFHGRTRLLVVIGANDDDASVHAEWQTLAHAAAALAAHQITVIPVLKVDTTSSAPRLNGLTIATLNEDGNAEARQRFGCGDTDFCIGLIDLTGETLLHATQPVPADQIIRTVDAVEAQRRAANRAAIAQRSAQLSGIIPPPPASAANLPAHSLSEFVGKSRVLAVFDMHADDAPFAAQFNLFNDAPAELARRNITVVPILRITAPGLPTSHGIALAALDQVGAAAARNQFHCANADFCAVLIDRDGTPLFNSPQPLTVASIIDLIDKTPTGQQESRTRTTPQNPPQPPAQQ